jgi:hypothetical protein
MTIPAHLFSPPPRYLGLHFYLGDLRLILTNILRFGALVSYIGPDRYILPKNLFSSKDGLKVMHDKLLEGLRLRRVVPTIP